MTYCYTGLTFKQDWPKDLITGKPAALGAFPARESFHIGAQDNPRRRGVKPMRVLSKEPQRMDWNSWNKNPSDGLFLVDDLPECIVAERLAQSESSVILQSSSGEYKIKEFRFYRLDLSKHIPGVTVRKPRKAPGFLDLHLSDHSVAKDGYMIRNGVWNENCLVSSELASMWETLGWCLCVISGPQSCDMSGSENFRFAELIYDVMDCYTLCDTIVIGKLFKTLRACNYSPNWKTLGRKYREMVQDLMGDLNMDEADLLQNILLCMDVD